MNVRIMLWHSILIKLHKNIPQLMVKNNFNSFQYYLHIIYLTYKISLIIETVQDLLWIGRMLFMPLISSSQVIKWRWICNRCLQKSEIHCCDKWHSNIWKLHYILSLFENIVVHTFYIIISSSKTISKQRSYYAVLKNLYPYPHLRYLS